MNPWLRKIFGANVFIYAFFIASRPLSDGDFWWHLKTGEYIFKNHSIPTTDLYSFTNYGKPWVTHEWLSELIFFVVYSRFGFNSLIFIFAVLTALAFWIVFKRSSAHTYVAGVATLLGVFSVLPTIGVRPRVFSLLFASIYLAVLTKYSKDGDRRLLWWLIPLMVLWVNLHAGFVVGLAFIALAIIGIPLDSWLNGEGIKSSWPRVKALALFFPAVTTVVMINPHGPRIYLFPFEFFLSPIQQNTVQDWLSPNFHDPATLPFTILALSTIAVLALYHARVKPGELLLFICTLYATLKSNRHVAMFALVAAPMLATYTQEFLNTAILRRRPDEATSSSRRKAIVFGLLLLVPVVFLIGQLRAEIYSGPRQERVGVPLKAVAFMKANNIVGNTFTDPNIWGGYFIWEMPSNPVYIDGRIDMYGDAFVKEFIYMATGLTDWRPAFDRYQVENAVISPKSVLVLQLEKSDEWARLYQDEMAIIFQRK